MKLLAITSYCDDENPNCSDNYPCKECLDMCNVFEINLSDIKYKYVGELQKYKQEKGDD